ncbi:hypothetical protein SI859A1_00756 [Aurantimonas manganoxydans SI85-9A1]|uniref:Uncharacterized protein n=1 Tax=Aurantimonas manganoxydans (strain ATCC BAA-1229 / DSM 21871 / SI85-9A1) TaxID=287752 RepID=Q1YK87_AURMS|nr:hypothetical protein SI859A1_00756 [Aurantimonas manganoxydans SI85-9A1]
MSETEPIEAALTAAERLNPELAETQGGQQESGGGVADDVAYHVEHGWVSSSLAGSWCVVVMVRQAHHEGAGTGGWLRQSSVAGGWRRRSGPVRVAARAGRRW